MKFAKLSIALVLVCKSLFVDAANAPGSLQQIGPPVATGSEPSGIAFSPVVSGNLFAAVPNLTDNNISVYLVKQTNGAFTQVSGSPFATGGDPTSIAFSQLTPTSPANLFAAVTNSLDGTVSVYLVSQTNGSFGPVPGSPFATGSGPQSVAFSQEASGNIFAAVANTFDDTVSVYLVNQTTGDFSPVAGSPFATGAAPIDVQFSPVVSGNLFAAVVNNNDNTVSVYEVNQSTGFFTPIGTVATGSAPSNIAFSQNPDVIGKLFAAVTNNGDNTVSVFQVTESTGAFTSVGPAVPAGVGPNAIAYSPIVLGNVFAGVADRNGNTVTAYQVATSTGVFTQVPDSPFAAGGGTDGFAYSPLVSGNLFAAATNFFDNTITVYQVTISVTPVSTLLPPSNFLGTIKKNVFLNKTEYFLKATWDPSPSPNVVSYRIYKNGQIVDEISAGSPLVFETRLHSKNSAKGFAITAVSSDNQESQQVNIRITND